MNNTLVEMRKELTELKTNFAHIQTKLAVLEEKKQGLFAKVLKPFTTISKKSFKIGMGIGLGLVASAIIAVTVSATFTDGNVLTATNLNRLKTAIESIPPWTKSGSDAVYSGGNVGIGTTISETWHTALLAVGIGPTSRISGKNVADAFGHLELSHNSYRNSSNVHTYIFADKASRHLMEAGTHKFSVNGTTGVADTAITWNDAMFIDTTGNVGIGTTSPGEKFTVTNAGTTGFLSKFLNSGGGSDDNGVLISAGSTTNEYALKVTDETGATTILAAKGNGNVGIGTASPTEKLV